MSDVARSSAVRFCPQSIYSRSTLNNCFVAHYFAFNISIALRSSQVFFNFLKYSFGSIPDVDDDDDEIHI